MPQCKPTEQPVREYLDYFLSLQEPPRFAFLINGAWGAGKTHFIKKYCEEWQSNREEVEGERPQASIRRKDPICISLNGISSIEQIDWAITQKRVPGLSNKHVGVASSFGVGLVKALVPGGASAGSLDLSKILPDLTSRLIVFDDFERCSIAPAELLGYINHLVEHAECWVVILANEGKVEDVFHEVKEKVVGHSMILSPQFGPPFRAFCEKRLSRKVKEAVLRKEALVERVFRQSETSNLRILDQSLMNVERVFGAIEQWLDCDAFLDHFLILVLALSLDVKSGRLRRSDLDFTVMLVRGAEDEGVKPALKETARRYDISFLSDAVLSDELWKEIMFDGLIDAQAIRNQAGESIYLSRPEDQASWRVVWHYLIMDPDVVDRAIKRMHSDFEERIWRSTAELLHVVGIAVRLHKDGIIPCSLEEIVKESYSYIDDVFADGDGFDRALVDLSADPIHFNGTGLGIMEHRSETFKQILDYLKTNQQHAVEYDLKARASDFADLIVSDIESASAALREGDKSYEHRNFLHYVDIARAAEAFCSCPGGHLPDLLSALSRRRDRGGQQNHSKETEWFAELALALQQKASHLLPIEAARARWIAERLGDTAAKD